MSMLAKPQGSSPHARLGLIALLVAATLLTAACGNAGDKGSSATTTNGSSTSAGSGDTRKFVSRSGVPGVTDREIHFTVLGTGDASPIGGCALKCHAAGVQAYFDYRNDQGGLYGRKLTMSVVDDELTNAQVRALEIAQSGNSFGVIAVPLIGSGFPSLTAAGIPIYTTLGLSDFAAGVDSTFAIGGVPCLSCVQPVFAYEPTIVGAKRVGVIGLNASQAAKDCVAGYDASIKAYGTDLGVKLVYKNDSLPFGLPNGLAPEVTAMHDAGVDFVATCLDPSGTITLEQELQKQGMGSVPVVRSGGAGDPTLLKNYASLMEGDLIRSTGGTFQNESNNAMMAAFLNYLAKTGDSKTDLDNALEGWIDADIAYQGLVAAGPEFDQASVIKATNAIQNYTAGGLIAPIDWGRQHDRPTNEDPVTHGSDPNCMSWVRVVKGKYQLVGKPDAPFFCWDPRKFDKWVAPTQTAFH